MAMETVKRYTLPNNTVKHHCKIKHLERLEDFAQLSMRHKALEA
jgi:hypothetical protein